MQRYTRVATIKSETSDAEYVVSRINNTGELACSCPGWRFKRSGRSRTCKHIEKIQAAVSPVSNAGFGRRRY